jgi:hypothetical protein
MDSFTFFTSNYIPENNVLHKPDTVTGTGKCCLWSSISELSFFHAGSLYVFTPNVCRPAHCYKSNGLQLDGEANLQLCEFRVVILGPLMTFLKSLSFA